jgi:prephenate dehydrogenase
VSIAEEKGFRRVAIVGLGLMGGSLARALKALPEPPHIRAASLDPGDVSAGLASGAVDEGSDVTEAMVRDRDLVVYATPLTATLRLLEEHGASLGRECVVTDVASLKGPVLARAREVGLEAQYVGSHPMVGGTGAGFEYSREDLFRSARVWIAAGAGAVQDSVDRVTRLWRAMGASPAEIGALEHDRSMVWLSHLPQIASNALALTLRDAGFERAQLGSGGADMTRLAGSAPEMWQDLLTLAPPSLDMALGALVDAVEGMRSLLDAQNFKGIEELMRQTRSWVGRGS